MQLKLDKDALRRRVAYVKDQLAIANEDIESLVVFCTGPEGVCVI
jgi:hypothetical protein